MVSDSINKIRQALQEKDMFKISRCLCYIKRQFIGNSVICFASFEVVLEFESICQELLVGEVLLSISILRIVFNGSMVNTTLEHLLSVDFLLHTIGTYESIHNDIFPLTYSVNSVNALIVISWIPIRVHYYRTIGSGQI